MTAIALNPSEQMPVGTAKQRLPTRRPLDEEPAAPKGDSRGRAEHPSPVACSARDATSRTGRSGAPHSFTGSAPEGRGPAPSALSFAARLGAADASRYLAEVWAIQRTPKTLAKLRCVSVGGGPAFLKAGRDVVYPRAALDAWANALMREPVAP